MIADLCGVLCEEAAGTLCGLPPGTVTAARAMGVGLAAGSGSTGSTGRTVERNSSGLSDEEERVVRTAVHNVAVTARRDNPDWSRRKAETFGMAVVLVASRLYSGEEFRKALVDAVSADPARHHRLVATVASAVR